MKKTILLIALILSLSITISVRAASTMYQKLDCAGAACVLRLSWTTHTDGTFTGFTTMNVDGWIDAIETDPGATAPTDNYDVSIANKVVSTINGTSTTTTRDITGDTGSWSGAEVTTSEDGVLANRDTANAEMTRLLNNGNYGGVMNIGPLLVDISNAGNSKVGVINIFFWKTK